MISMPRFTSALTFVSYLFFLICFFCFQFDGVTVSAQDGIHRIGAIIDFNSRTGKEENVSMEIAIQAFNSARGNKHKLELHVSDSGGDILQALAAAEDLIKEKNVTAIMGMDTWNEASLVTEVANRARVPILSFSAPSVTPSLRWPFLVRMASNNSLQMECVASLVGYYGWRRVIAIYEDGSYNTDSGIMAHLSDALHSVHAEIEHWLTFPPFTTLSDPKAFIHHQLEEINRKQSRVFIIVGSSLELATRIFAQARDVGLMGRDSVWITTDSVTNLLHTVNSSVMSSMQGIIGIKTHFSETSPSFLSFSTKFRNLFQSNHPQEDKSEPGFPALRAYDTVFAVATAIEKSVNNKSSRLLLDNILSSKFNGLSGNIQFHNAELSASPTYEIVNVVGKSYTVPKFWSLDYGFTDKVIDESSSQQRKKSEVNAGTIKVRYWPGDLDRVPRGWVMPSDAKPMVIGVPGRTSFETFVNWNDGEEPKGFCIDVFNDAVKLLDYDLPHIFEKFDGLYDDLVDQVYLKKFDAVVGDITILANRSNYVEFTQPYAESGLTMVVPVKPEGRGWLFVRPFTSNMWLVVCIIFMYTMFVVWFLEHRSNNPEFRGPWKKQLSTAMWFTFSTIFFAHRENLRSNFTRVVIMVWLLVVFVVTSGYTAALTSMLTVQRLEPTVTDIGTLRRSNSPVGCDPDSFIRKYIEQVLKFDPKNIRNVTSDYSYIEYFRNGTIKAAFLELPYERIFLPRYRKEYQIAGPTHRFGGFGFVFPKGSPIAADFSKAFLKLSEDGTLNKLDEYWFKSALESSESGSDMTNQSLGLANFGTLFLITGLTSTAMLIVYIVQLYMKLRRHSVASPGTTSRKDDSFWNGIKRLGKCLDNSQFHRSHTVPVSAQAGDVEIMVSHQSTPESETKMAETYIGDPDPHTRLLKVANTFPYLDMHAHGFSGENSTCKRIPRST